FAAAEVIANDLARLPAEKTYARPGQGTQPLIVLSGTNDDQSPPQPLTGRNRQIDSLVGSKGRHHEVIILAVHGGGKVEVGVCRGIDHLTGPAITFSDPLLYRTADGDEMSDPFGSAAIPGPDLLHQPVGRTRPDPAQPPRAEVGGTLMPGIAHGREAVAD